MNKFLKDPWNQLALIVFAMSLSYIFLKFDYFRSFVKGGFSMAESSSQDSVALSSSKSDKSGTSSAPKKELEEPQQDLQTQPSSNSTDSERKPNSISENYHDQKINAQQLQPQVTHGTSILVHALPPQQQVAQANVDNSDDEDDKSATSSHLPNVPNYIPTPNGSSPAIAAAIAKLNADLALPPNGGNSSAVAAVVAILKASLARQQSASATNNAPSVAAAPLPPPTKTFSMSDVKISGKGYKHSWSLRQNSAADPKIDMKSNSHEWIVDVNKGAGSDTDSIKQAFAMASKGDTIRIRDGEYSEEFNMRFDVKIVGEDSSKVIIRYKNENLFIENSKLDWSGFTLKVENLSGYNSVHVKQSDANFKNIIFDNVSFKFENSNVEIENVKFRNIKTHSAALFFKQSFASILKVTARDIEGDFISLDDNSEAFISSAEINSVKYSAIAVKKSKAQIVDVKAYGIESFAFLFSESLGSKVQKISCSKCRYGLHVTDSKIEVDSADFYSNKMMAVLVNKSEMILTNLKIDKCDSAISVNNSKLTLTLAKINYAKLGLTLYDNNNFKSSEVDANNVQFTMTELAWNWSKKIGGGMIRGQNNVPEIQDKKGDFYVRH